MLSGLSTHRVQARPHHDGGLVVSIAVIQSSCFILQEICVPTCKTWEYLTIICFHSLNLNMHMGVNVNKSM